MLEIEKRVLDAIDTEGMLKYLCDLISIRSLGGEEADAQKHVAAQMKRIGLEVDTWELDFSTLKQNPHFSMEVKRDEGLGVVGVIGERKGGRDLIFNGHIDVAPPGDEANWHHSPWKGSIEDGRVYGRGSADMKGGLCCALFASKALIDAGIRLRGKLMVESVIGEEDGGVGTLASVLRGYKADGALIAEPTKLKIATSQAGALCFRVMVHGRAAHACVRGEGVSAIDKFIPIYKALMALEMKRNRRIRDPLYAQYKLPYPLNIGKVQAGNWPSSVAETLVFEGRYGVAVGEKVSEASRMFEETVARVTRADPWLRVHKPVLKWWGGQFEPAKIPVEHPIVQTVEGAFADITRAQGSLVGVTYGSDMRLLVNVGATPAVLFGPGDVRVSHRPDEYVQVKELAVAVRTLALTALRFCGYE